MNRNYIFLLGIVVIVIILLMVFYSPIITSMALQQIILTQDCDGIDKWSKTVASEFDFLLISESQMNDVTDLSDECYFKMIENNKSTDTTDPMVILDELLKKRDCDVQTTWLANNRDLDNIPGLTISILDEMVSLLKECQAKELEKFLRESNLSTDTTDPMVVLGKILNKRDCGGLVKRLF